MLKVRELMTSDVLTLSPDTTIRQAAEQFAIAKVGASPVVRRGKVVGMLSPRDLLDFIASLPVDPAEVTGGGDHGILEDHTVEEAMTLVPLHSIGPDDLASRAAELMKAHRIHHLPVVDGELLIGIISALDLVRAVAERKLTYRTHVFPR